MLIYMKFLAAKSSRATALLLILLLCASWAQPLAAQEASCHGASHCPMMTAGLSHHADHQAAAVMEEAASLLVAHTAAPSAPAGLKMACCQVVMMGPALKPASPAALPQGFIAPARENQLASLALDNLFRPPRA
jgi:hypothetical protein